MQRPIRYDNSATHRNRTISRKNLNRPNSKKSKNFIILILVIILSFILIVKIKPHKKLTLSQPSNKIPTSKITNCAKESNNVKNNGNNYNLKWPKKGFSSIGSFCSGDFWTNDKNDKIQHSIASLTKVITALVVLKEKQGTNINERNIYITKKYADFYKYENMRQGTALLLKKGVNYSLKEMIDAMFLVSANNVADVLVLWAFGSFNNYKIAAQKFLSDNGLNNTTIGNDANGIDNKTTSTVKDLFKLGKIAANNSIVMQSAKLKSSKIHFGKKKTETVSTNNKLLYYQGFVGLKTGYTKKAGACIIFIKKYKKDYIIGVILKQDNSGDRLKVSVKLAKSFESIYD